MQIERSDAGKWRGRRRKCRPLSHRNTSLFDAKMSLLSVTVCCSLLQSIAVCCSHHKTRLFDAKMSLLSVTVCCSLLQSIAVCCSHHKTRLFDAKMSLLSKKHTTRSHVSYFIFFREKLICNILPRMYHIFCLSRKRTTLELQCESTVPQSPCGKRTPPDL